MRKAVTFALATSVLLSGCAASPRRTIEATIPEMAATHDVRASCESMIYRAADYDKQTGLACAQLLDIWH